MAGTPPGAVAAARDALRSHVFGGDVSKSVVATLLQMELPSVIAFVEYGFVDDDVITPAHASVLRQITAPDQVLLRTLHS